MASQLTSHKLARPTTLETRYLKVQKKTIQMKSLIAKSAKKYKYSKRRISKRSKRELSKSPVRTTCDYF
jgi:hypothetical protein